jgi:hypothetical protein
VFVGPSWALRGDWALVPPPEPQLLLVSYFVCLLWETPAVRVTNSHSFGPVTKYLTETS